MTSTLPEPHLAPPQLVKFWTIFLSNSPTQDFCCFQDRVYLSLDCPEQSLAVLELKQAGLELRDLQSAAIKGICQHKAQSPFKVLISKD